MHKVSDFFIHPVDSLPMDSLNMQQTDHGFKKKRIGVGVMGKRKQRKQRRMEEQNKMERKRGEMGERERGKEWKNGIKWKAKDEKRKILKEEDDRS